MALTEVGLKYISDGIDSFLRGAKNATDSVSSLNKTLADSNAISTFNKNINSVGTNYDSLSKKTKTLGSNVASLSGDVVSLNKPFEDVRTNSEKFVDGLEQASNTIEVTGLVVNRFGEINSILSDSLFVTKSASFGLANTFEILKNSANGLSNLTDINKDATLLQQTFLALPTPLQNVVIKFAEITQNAIKAYPAVARLADVLIKYVGFGSIFDFLDPVKLQKSAQDANTLSKALKETGNSLNKLENLFRGFALGLKIIELRVNNGKKAIEAMSKSLIILARGIDSISDFFGDWSKSVKVGDKNIQDFNKEQGIAEEGTKGWTSAIKDNKIELVKSFIAIGGVAKKINDVANEEIEAKGPVGVLFDALHLKTLISIWTKMPPPIQAATAALGAFVGASVLTKVIGGRAADLTAISDSFESFSQAIGLSSTFLDDFADSADNQLTKRDLLIKSNKALAGSTGEFATELANSLPLLLEFARVRSAATGEDVNFLFESAIQGIKKGQPLILDNLGLVVKLETVYEDFAKTLNKTTNDLTANEKQMALLKATNAAATESINILGEATLSNADKMAAQKNMISDILNSISLSVQPLLSVILDIENRIIELLMPFVDLFNTVLSAVSTIIADIVEILWTLLDPIIELVIWNNDFSAVVNLLLKPLMRLWDIFAGVALSVAQFVNVLKPLIDVLNASSYLLSRVGDLLVGIIDFFVLFGNSVRQAFNEFIMGIPFVNSFITFFVNGIEVIKERIGGLRETVDQFIFLLGFGFGAALGSLVNVFAKAASQILGLVADLAEGIASFLIGQSPPPKGPLSKIDVGGAKTFEAFLDGMKSVGVSPVAKVAANVDRELGKIGKMSLPQVEKRLAQLDLGIRPFTEQLEIVKSRFDAISGPAEAALRAIERQQNEAVKALVSGDVGAAASVRALDMQRASIQRNLELQQQQVDFAQIELAISQSKQAEERALLGIQQKRLEGLELTTQEQKKLNDAQKAEPKETSKSGASSSAGGAESSSFAKAKESPTGSAEGDSVLQGFASTFDKGLTDDIATQQQRIGAAGKDISSGIKGLPNRIAGAFSGIGSKIKGFLNQAWNGIKEWFNDIVNGFTNLPTQIQTGLDAMGVGIGIAWDNIATATTTKWDEISTNVSGGIDTAQTNISTSVASISGSMMLLGSYFGEGGIFRTKFMELFGEEGVFRATLNGLFGEEGFFGSKILYAQQKLSELGAFFENKMNFITALFGEEGAIRMTLASFFGEEGFLNTTLNSGKDLFDTFYNVVFGPEGLFAGLGVTLKALLLAPLNAALAAISGTINFFIGVFETFINNILSTVQTVITAIPENLRGPLADIPTSVTFGEVNFSIPDVEGAATGGLFSGGTLRVGERGEEFVTSAERMAVFPNEFVTGMSTLTSLLVKAMSIPSPNNIGGNTNNNNNVNNNNNTININQPMNPLGVRQQFNNLESF